VINYLVSEWCKESASLSIAQKPNQSKYEYAQITFDFGIIQ